MLISEFARTTALSVDTVRFYVRRGLLRPKVGAKGGSNPYQQFADEDVFAAQTIHLGQALGMSLTDIGTFLEDHRCGKLTPEKTIGLLAGQRDRLRERERELQAMSAYLEAKITWLRGRRGTQPLLQDYLSPEHGRKRKDSRVRGRRQG